MEVCEDLDSLPTYKNERGLADKKTIDMFEKSYCLMRLALTPLTTC